MENFIMRKFIILLILIIFLPCFYAGASELFVNSNPIRANVEINGAIVGRTPVRIILQPLTEYKLKIYREGYKKIEKSIKLQKNEVKNIFLELAPDKIEIVLKDEGKIVEVCGDPIGKTPAIVYNIPNGVYRLEKTDKYYKINPALYSYSIRSSIIESIYMGGMLTFLLLKSNEARNNGDSVYSTAFNIGALLASSILGYDLYKIFKLKMAEEKNISELKKAKIRPYSMKKDRELFSDGVRFIGEGKYRNAIEKFSLIINLYEDSQYVPVSYYELGYSYFMLNDFKNSEKYFRTYLYEYPSYEMYSFGFYYYIESLVKNKKYLLAAREFFDYSPEVLDDDSGKLYELYYGMIAPIAKKVKREDRIKLANKMIKYLDYFLDKYKGSSYQKEIMIMKGKLIYRYINRDRGLLYLKKVKELYPKMSLEEVLRDTERAGNYE